MIPLVSAQLLETLLGQPLRSLSSNAEPPILGTGGRTHLVLAADEAAFVQIIGQGSRPQDVRLVVEKISQELNRTLRRRRLECRAAAFPPQCDELARPKTVLGALTPYSFETGGPVEKEKGKNQTLLMVRLALSQASDGHVLASREFFSGYTLPKPRAER
jgi:hypothetical protein